MKKKSFYILILLFFFSLHFGLAQNPKSFYKEGKALFEAESYEASIIPFTKAIELKPEYEKAIILRAQAYEKTKKIEEAANDYKTLCLLDPKEEEYYHSAGKHLYALEAYAEAVKYLTFYTEAEEKDMRAQEMKFESLFAIKQFDAAKVTADKLIDLDDEKPNYYFLRAVTLDSLKQYVPAAADYETTLAKKPTEACYEAYANMMMKAKQTDRAHAICDRAIAKYPQVKAFYFIRAEVYAQKLDYPNAINDLSRITVIDKNDLQAYTRRAQAYSDFNQFQSAISDYGKIIALKADNYLTYYKRGLALQEISDKKGAIRDFKKVQELTVSKTSQDKKVLTDVQMRLYNLLKETNKPVIEIVSPAIQDKQISVAMAQNTLVLEGKIIDESTIKALTVQGKTVMVKNNSFTTTVALANTKAITLEATDAYDNTCVLKMPVLRHETNAPTVKLLSPFASENGEVMLEGDASNMHVEGSVQDESLIKRITINGVNASFSPSSPNPSFTAIVNIRGVEKLEIEVADIYDNVYKRELNLNRESALMMSANPMGKTWMVFIENSNYETFASLEGPGKDVLMMKNALANYQLHNVIHKKDLGKSEMERFFSIELRDLIRSNNVNSLIVWYAGHGKFINETGYWIPVDAKRDDEFTYFNIGNLKASMNAYSKNITHTLVITDACESGPSFYQAMRSIADDNKSCDDPQATRFKSSQVFSSAGYELASDNSQFTKAFAKSLEINGGSCIAIESIVKTVTKAVKDNEQQVPKFGKIYGMEDENGTFFFIKK